MAETADVVVIGGGVIGTSFAYALVSHCVKRVSLLEKSALVSGTSGRSSALVRMHYTNEEDARLAWASCPVFRDWTRRTGGPPGFTSSGVVAVVGPEDAAALRSNVEMPRGIGIETVTLSPSDLKTLQPFANVDGIGTAAYEPASGYASPADVVEGLRRQARAHATLAPSGGSRPFLGPHHRDISCQTQPPAAGLRHRRAGVCPVWRPPTPDRHAARSRGHPDDPRAPRPLPLWADSRPRPTRVRRDHALIRSARGRGGRPEALSAPLPPVRGRLTAAVCLA